METFMSVVLVVAAVLAGVVLIVAGVFSVLALLWGDLLEAESRKAPGGEVTKAA